MAVDLLALALLSDLDEPLEIRVRHDLPTASQRLLDSLGVRVVVDESASRCAQHCKECRVIESRTARAMPLGHAVPVMSRSTGRSFKDSSGKSAEQIRADEQAAIDGQQVTSRCGLCDWTFTGTFAAGRAAAAEHRAAAHSQTGAARRNRSGYAINRWGSDDDQEREAAMVEVERRRRTTHAATDVGAAVGHAAESGSAASSGEPERAATTTQPMRRRSQARERWTPEAIIEAIQAYTVEHGHTPSNRAWAGKSTTYPNWQLVARVFGSWSAAIVAAGYPRPVRGRINYVTATSATVPEREPEASPGDSPAAVVAAPTGAQPSRSDTVALIQTLIDRQRGLLDELEQLLATDGAAA